MRNDAYYMMLAVKKAREGIRAGQTPFGACIVHKGTVVACAHNSVWKTMDPVAHAEIRAIRQACRKLKTIDLRGSILYSTCEPCPMCFAASHWARIAKIVYGASITDARRFGFHELEISTSCMKAFGKSSIRIAGGLLREENIALFKEWSTLKKSRAY